MKKIALAFTMLVTVIICISAGQGSSKSLLDVYSSGKASLTPEAVINYESLPEGVFFESVDDIAIDKKGSLFVVDHEASNIKKFTQSGEFLKTIGTKGQGPGEFNWPLCITVSGDRLIVWDVGSRKIMVFTSEGEFLTSKKFDYRQNDSGMVFPSLKKMKSLPNGDIVIHIEKRHYNRNEVKPQECTISIYSPELELKKILFSQNIWREKIILTSGWNDIVMPFPTLVYWDITPEGKIVIGFSEKYEIGIYDSIKGKIKSFSHTYEQLKVTRKDKEDFFTKTKYWFSRMGQTGMMDMPKEYKEHVTFPENKPAYHKILVDSEGNILVFGQTRNDKNPQYFDVFYPNGEFLKHVVINEDAPSLENQQVTFSDKGFWMKEFDENELIKIVKYRISK